MPLPCPICGSNEAIWEVPEPAQRSALKALFRPLEVLVQASNTFRGFGWNAFGLTARQRSEPVRASGRRLIKRWHCPTCGESGRQGA